MKFEHIVIDDQTPGILNDVCLVADVNGNGYNDIVIGGKKGEKNIVWYEYPSWNRHTIGTANFEAGGVMLDISGNGLPDLVAGNPAGLNDGKALLWFENSGDPGKEWCMRSICEDFKKYHHQAAGDIDGDGRPEILFLSQLAGVLGYYNIPEDPRQAPWPKKYLHIISTDVEHIEGLAIADIDGDGRMEVIAGPYWFKYNDGRWKRNTIDASMEKICVAVGDINNDGKPEVVLSEGESHAGRLAWYGNAPKFDVKRVLNEELFHPHSLAIADFDNDGQADIFTAEMGLGRHPGKPKLFIYLNKGEDRFEPFIVDEGRATHEAKAADIGNTGRASIVGKPFNPGTCVEIWLNKE